MRIDQVKPGRSFNFQGDGTSEYCRVIHVGRPEETWILNLDTHEVSFIDPDTEIDPPHLDSFSLDDADSIDQFNVALQKFLKDFHKKDKEDE